MSIKVRKVGNSMVLTVPAEVAESLGMYEGQSYNAVVKGSHLEYQPTKASKRKVDWNKYKMSGKNTRDGMSPDEYVRRLRSNDR